MHATSQETGYDELAAAALASSETLFMRWADYRHLGSFESFVEFALALNSLTALLGQMRLSGLARSYERLESQVLALFGDANSHPIDAATAGAIQRDLATMLDALRRGKEARRSALAVMRNTEHSDEAAPGRGVLVVCEPNTPTCSALVEALRFHGFDPRPIHWRERPMVIGSPLAVVFAAGDDSLFGAEQMDAITELRPQHEASHFLCTGVPPQLDIIIALQRAGIDDCVQAGRDHGEVLSRLFELVAAREQDQPRVLVVEDSSTAVAYIRRSLTQHGIDSHAIKNPQQLLDVAVQYEPDLVLMDMHMPHLSGVEATRALRQLDRFRSVPIVYLSSETDIASQVEALRLGGDQFLTKPANPVLLAAVVKTKIERHREMRRLATSDSLTGLLNHSAAKDRLDALIAGRADQPLSVAMIDIDRFKSINDTYGHPVGDRVIKSLAWLITGRLRRADPIGRYGGEEFIVGLPGLNLDAALAALDRLRRDFARLLQQHAEGDFYATFSCGLAEFSRNETVDRLITRADDALLRAKNEGRNRVVCDWA